MKHVKQTSDSNHIYMTYKMPIFAGMEFTYPGTKKNKLSKIGHYFVKLTYSLEYLLLKEEKFDKVFY